MRVATAGLIFLNIAFEAAGVCPVSIPADAWGPSAWKQAISAGKWRGTVAPKGQGFNRTVFLSGLCDDAWTSSVNYACIKSGNENGEGGEFKMRALNASVPGSVKLSFGGSVCTLSEISFYRTAPAAEPLYDAEMRMEFNSCVPPLVPSRSHSAAVVVGLSKGQDDSTDMELLSWANKVCAPQTTSAAPTKNILFGANYTVLKVGSGKCAAVVLKSVAEKVNSDNGCQTHCTEWRTSAHITPLDAGDCHGYAYEETTQKCILYSSAVTQVNTSTNAGWSCSNISYVDADATKSIQTSTAAPTPVAPSQISLSKLLLSTTAYLQDVTTEASADCAPTKQGTNTFWWFTLQDRVGAVQALPIKKSEYQAFLDLLPPVARFQGAKAADTRKVPATQVIDRVLFETCAGTDRWANQQCYVPSVDDTNCLTKGIWTGFFTGVGTAVFAWVLFYCWWLLHLKIRPNRSSGQNDEGRSRTIGSPYFRGFMFVIVFLAACGAAWAIPFLSAVHGISFLDEVNMSGDCYDAMAYAVMPVVVSFAVALAVIIAPWYLADQYPGMQEKALNGEKPRQPDRHKLMLVDVPIGDGTAKALDSMNAEQDEMGQRYIGFVPDSPYASYNAPFDSTRGE